MSLVNSKNVKDRVAAGFEKKPSLVVLAAMKAR